MKNLKNLKGGVAMERQNFAMLNKRRIITAWFEGVEHETHITLLRVVETEDYYIVIEKVSKDFDKRGTLFYHRFKVQGNLVVEFKKAVEEYAQCETLRFYNIDKKLREKAKILYTSNDLFNENLEKIRPLLLDKRQKMCYNNT
jgi:hypothetical protein